MITLDEAQELLHSGAHFKDVEELVDESLREELRRYFCCTPGLPNLEARKPKHWAGEECPKCGGQMAWRGSCKQCTICAEGGSCG